MTSFGLSAMVCSWHNAVGHQYRRYLDGKDFDGLNAVAIASTARCGIARFVINVDNGGLNTTDTNTSGRYSRFLVSRCHFRSSRWL